MISKKPSLGFLVAGFLLAISSLSLGWLTPDFKVESNPVFAVMRLTDIGQNLGIACLFLGAFLLLIMWLNVEHEIHTPRELARFALSASLPSLLMPPLFSRDVYSYVAQGHLQLAGFNPYQVGVAKLEDWFKFGIDPMWAQTTTPYGAAYLLIEKFAAWISIDSTYTSMVFLRGVNIAAFVITIYGINRLAKIHNISQNFAMWLAVLNPITILHLVNAVHNDSLMIAAIVWGFVFAHEKRLVTASLTVAFAVAIKPIALIALPFLAISKNPQFNLQQRIKDWSSTAIVSLSALAALGYATGTGFGWVNAISTPGTVLNLAAPISLISEILDKSLSWFGHDLGETIFPLIRFTGLVFCGLYVAKKSLDKSNESGTRRAGLALACMILLSPVVFPWYFLWPLALFAASGLRTTGALKISVYGTLLVVAYSIIEAVAVRDSAITPQDLLFSAFVFAAVFSLMRFKENKEIFEMEQAHVS